MFVSLISLGPLFVCFRLGAQVQFITYLMLFSCASEYAHNTIYFHFDVYTVLRVCIHTIPFQVNSNTTLKSVSLNIRVAQIAFLITVMFFLYTYTSICVNTHIHTYKYTYLYEYVAIVDESSGNFK